MNIIFSKKMRLSALLLMNPELIARASKLFSENYAVWSQGHQKAGYPVRLAPDRFAREILFDSRCHIAQVCRALETINIWYVHGVIQLMAK
jgi:hypothetical protein